MTQLEILKLEQENWNLKGVILNTQQALMQFQAKEINFNLERLNNEISALTEKGATNG